MRFRPFIIRLSVDINSFFKRFLALSQAPPALFWNIPIRTPHTVAPAKNPPKTSGPKINPINNGEIIAIAPGSIIFLIEASVEMATHFSYSGCAFPSKIPGISRNYLRTSSTIAIAACPTAVIANEENIKGIIPLQIIQPKHRPCKYQSRRCLQSLRKPQIRLKPLMPLKRWQTLFLLLR